MKTLILLAAALCLMNNMKKRIFNFKHKFKQIKLDPNNPEVKRLIDRTIKEQEKTMLLKYPDKETLEMVIN